MNGNAATNPVPSSADPAREGLDFLSQVEAAVRDELATSEPLRTFLESRQRLSRDERRLLVGQARQLLEAAYVHLPQKRAMYAVDPIQQLRLLEFRLDQTPDDQLPPALDFHNEMTEIFTALRDLHTNYLLPEPYQDRVAYLPFLIEEYFDQRNVPHYIVSKMLDGVSQPPFETGVEVLYWNGIPIRRALSVRANQQAGANRDARHALSVAGLTIRPMVRVLPPTEEWVRITFRGRDRKTYDFQQPWLVYAPAPEDDALARARMEGDTLAYGFDLQAEQIQHTRKVLFAPQAVQAERLIASGRAMQAGPMNGLETSFPGVLLASEREIGGERIGYLRIFSFMVQDADAFVAEVQRLLRLLPPRGLIVDVRGNGGGNILASERLLQLLTDGPIEPQRWQFINSPLTLALSRRYDDLAVWASSIAQAVQLGTLHSLAFPITSKESCNAVGRAYPGPVVLIVDARCYSATDVFAAGFQDHKIGLILGTSGNTGAGGANVWTHEDLVALLSAPGDWQRWGGAFRRLPRGAGMRVAIRRAIRVGENAGIPVEDLGVRPNDTHAITLRDLLNDNADLLEHACQMLTPE